MRKSDELFSLVKSLSKSEKRYFKIQASRHQIRGKNIYVRLFDEIDRMDEYNEEAIKNKFKDEKFIKTLFATKHYLFNIIVKNLTEFYLAHSLRQRINKMTEEFSILFNKGLFRHAEHKLKKAKQLALKNEMFELVLEILNLENSLLTRINFTNRVYNLYLKNKEEKQLISRKLNNFTELIYIYNLLSVIWQKDKPPDERDRQWIKNTVTINPMFNKTDNAISYKGKLVFLRILYITSEIQQNTKRSYGYLQKIVTLADSNAELIQNFTGPYIHSLSNLILFQISMYKFKEAEINIAKLKNLRKGFELNISTESTVFYYTYLLQMALYIETIQLDKGIELIAEIESKLNIYKDNIIKYRVMQFYFFFADLNFLKGNYDKSLEWLNKILNREPSEVSPETLCFSRVLRLLIHYEKNNYDLVESLANSTKRSIKRQQNPYQFEKLVTEFMLEAIKLKNDKDTKYTLMRLKKELQKLFIYDYEKNAIENLGLITWIKSKTSNKPLIEILQQELDQKLNIRK